MVERNEIEIGIEFAKEPFKKEPKEAERDVVILVIGITAILFAIAVCILHWGYSMLFSEWRMYGNAALLVIVSYIVIGIGIMFVMALKD